MGYFAELSWIQFGVCLVFGVSHSSYTGLTSLVPNRLGIFYFSLKFRGVSKLTFQARVNTTYQLIFPLVEKINGSRKWFIGFS